MFVVKKSGKYIAKDLKSLTGTIKEAHFFENYDKAKEEGDTAFINDYEICEVEVYITKSFYIYEE